MCCTVISGMSLNWSDCSAVYGANVIACGAVNVSEVVDCGKKNDTIN